MSTLTSAGAEVASTFVEQVVDMTVRLRDLVLKTEARKDFPDPFAVDLARAAAELLAKNENESGPEPSIDLLTAMLDDLYEVLQVARIDEADEPLLIAAEDLIYEADDRRLVCAPQGYDHTF